MVENKPLAQNLYKLSSIVPSHRQRKREYTDAVANVAYHEAKEEREKQREQQCRFNLAVQWCTYQIAESLKGLDNSRIVVARRRVVAFLSTYIKVVYDDSAFKCLF